MKKSLEKNKWYVLKSNPNIVLVYIRSLNNSEDNYGFVSNGEWFENEDFSWNYLSTPKDWVEATTEQILERLSIEAVKRGFGVGVAVNTPTIFGNGSKSNKNILQDFSNLFYVVGDNSLRVEGGSEDGYAYIVFKDGVWADVTEFSEQDILKREFKKLKKQVKLISKLIK